MKIGEIKYICGCKVVRELGEFYSAQHLGTQVTAYGRSVSEAIKGSHIQAQVIYQLWRDRDSFAMAEFAIAGDDYLARIYAVADTIDLNDDLHYFGDNHAEAQAIVRELQSDSEKMSDLEYMDYEGDMQLRHGYVNSQGDIVYESD